MSMIYVAIWLNVNIYKYSYIIYMNSSCMSMSRYIFEMLEEHKVENHFIYIAINMSH
jgi:hypothetical protein